MTTPALPVTGGPMSAVLMVIGGVVTGLGMIAKRLARLPA